MGTSRSFGWTFALVSALILHNLVPAIAQCSTALTFRGSKLVYAQCITLPYHNASLAWNYYPDNLTFQFAYSGVLTKSGGWVGWGFNPASPQMTGGSALIAFQSATNGSNVLPYRLTGSESGPSSVNFVWINPNSSSVEIDSLKTTIFATFQLKAGQTKFTQLWNRGDSVTDFTPHVHSQSGDNMLSLGDLDVTTGTITVVKAPNSDLKNRHGIINGVAWGILFPLGVMAARYLRPFVIFDPLWFYIHSVCQVLGYVLGCIGFGMGLKLQKDSSNVRTKHRDIGITLFVFATLQIFAVVLRPRPEHKLRMYWNVYHHSIGFTVLICSVINIYEGIEILQPATGWKSAYTAILITMGVGAVLLEIVTWSVWLHRRAQLRQKRLAGASAPVTATDPRVEMGNV